MLSCSARAGLPAYVAGFSTECDTLPQHHTRFGTSPAGLLACARHGYGGTTASVEVNGTTYDATRFAAASGDQPIQAALGNPISGNSRNSAGRFVAYGNGVLIHSLGKGTYKIIERNSHQGTASTYTYTVHVS